MAADAEGETGDSAVAGGSSWHTITLPVVVEAEQMPAVRDELLLCLQRGEAARIDAREVCRISTAAIQVLVSAARTFAEAGVKLYYADPADFIDISE